MRGAKDEQHEPSSVVGSDGIVTAQVQDESLLQTLIEIRDAMRKLAERGSI